MSLKAENRNLIFSINNESIIAENAYELGKWVTISTVLNGTEAKLVVNGQTAVTGTINAGPVDVVSADAVYTIGGLEASMDFFRVNFKEVTEPEYYYTETEEITEPIPTETEESQHDPYMTGDVNYDGIINIYDLIQLKKNILNGAELNYQTVSSDVNSDGEISVADIIALQKFLLGKSKTLR